MEARRVKLVEMKPFHRFVHFLVMKNEVPRFGKRDTNNYVDLIYMDHLTSTRLVNLPRVMMRYMNYVISMKDHELPYGDWLTMGESGSDDQFYDAQVEVEEPVAKAPAVPVFPASPGDSKNQQKETEAVGVDPSAPTGSIPDSVMSKLQAEFERARANRIQANLEKAQPENA
ncbi:hypothetical protein Dimus_018246 [Dionaea muscipula]